MGTNVLLRVTCNIFFGITCQRHLKSFLVPSCVKSCRRVCVECLLSSDLRSRPTGSKLVRDLVICGGNQ